MHALVSIHDVMPDTLERVERIIKLLPAVCRSHLTLLVVPGLKWSAAGINQLRCWQDQGYRLAGHGWSHRAARVRGAYHRLHAWLISRDAAEHLALNRQEILELMRDNHAWFVAQGLRQPDYYVPPAWAMGPVKREDLADSPFRYFETTSGLYDARSNATLTLPLAGFEADNRFRRLSLTAWNAANARLVSPKRPLRIGLHPFDLELMLADAVPRYLQQVTHSYDYAALFNPRSGAP